MKIYSICEYCQEIYENDEIDGPEGIVELKGICGDCLGELKRYENAAFFNQRQYYN